MFFSVIMDTTVTRLGYEVLERTTVNINKVPIITEKNGFLFIIEHSGVARLLHNSYRMNAYYLFGFLRSSIYAQKITKQEKARQMFTVLVTTATNHISHKRLERLCEQYHCLAITIHCIIHDYN